MSNSVKNKKMTVGLTILAVCLILNAVVGSVAATYTFVIGHNDSLAVLIWAYVTSAAAFAAWWGIVKLKAFAWLYLLAFAVLYISSDILIPILGGPVSELALPIPVVVGWLFVWLLLAYYVYKKTVAAPNQSLKSGTPKDGAP